MTCNLRPIEYNVVIKPKSAEKVTKGGIILTDKAVEADKLASDEGEIVAVSDLAFNYDDYPEESRPKIGDVVKFSRYAGITIRNEAGEIEFRIVKDKEIWAVVVPMGEVIQFPPKIDLSDHITLPPVSLSSVSAPSRPDVMLQNADEIAGDCA